VAIFTIDQRKEQRVCISASTQFLAKHKIAVIPHPPYSPDLAPCDSFLFPKMKLKPKGRWFDTNEISAESQRVLDTDRKELSGSVPKIEEKGGTGVYMREGTTSRVMAADRPYDEFYDFYRSVRIFWKKTSYTYIVQQYDM
jgi:hypothetical protein